jgi:two-component system, OmpR family, alkaline phosphatase synthesis response regulator PhoP
VTDTTTQARILLVDDESDLVETLKFRLEANGYDVLTALDGSVALTKAREEHPALIILDLMLPKVNGFEVCQALKQDHRYAHIPIIILTAKILDADERHSRECGADAYIRKPFQTQELLDAMQSLLQTAQEAHPS